MTAFGLLLAALAGGAAGWSWPAGGGLSQLGARRVARTSCRTRRSTGCAACYRAWGVDRRAATSARGPGQSAMVDGERLSVAQIVAVDRRLERARDQEQSGAERMEGGTLVFHAAGGVAVGLLLPDGFGSMRLAEAEIDLRRLLDGVRRRPHLVELAQAQSQGARRWSRWAAWAFGWRTSSSALSMARWSSRRSSDQAAQPVRVIGVSGRATGGCSTVSSRPRASWLVSPGASTISSSSRATPSAERWPTAGAARPSPAAAHPAGDPLVARSPSGSRRQGADRVGARAEIMEAISNAGPRALTALWKPTSTRRRHDRSASPGSHNRRGFDEAFSA